MGVGMRLHAFHLPNHLERGLKLVKTRDGVGEAEQVRRALADDRTY